MGNPLPLDLAQECRKAQKILTEFVDPAHGGLDRVIPMSVLRRAQGLAIFSVARLGFLMSARAGSGVVLARMSDDSWSSPSALGLGGLGAGFNVGLDVTDFVIVLNTRQAVRSFMATGSLQLGGNMSVAVGPLGRAAEASGAVNSSGNLAAMFSYSKSKGLYGGVSVEGTILVDRADANSKAYHRTVTAKQILSGSEPIPTFATPLISLIEKFTMTGEVRAGMDGRSASARGYGNYEDEGEDDLGDLDRDFRHTSFGSRSENLSPPLSPPYSGGDSRDEYSRPSSYAFGAGSRGSMTNSPTRTRKSFLGGTSSIVGGTDYTDEGTGNGVFDSSNHSFVSGNKRLSIKGEEDTFARSGVQPRRRDAPPPPPTSFMSTSRSAYDHDNNARSRAFRKGTTRFPTQFEQSSESSDDEAGRAYTSSSKQSARDPFDFGDDDDDDDVRANGNGNYFGSTQSVIPSRPRQSPLISSRRDKHDDLDLEVNRDAQQRYNQQADLIDFGGAGDSYGNRSNATLPSSSSNYRRRAKGMDSLDEELQQRRDSVSTDESRDRYSYERTRNTTATTGWRADFGLPDDDFAAPPQQQKRPPMHQRTSSAQKLWNRVRGNSQSSNNNSKFADAWNATSSGSYSSPPPNLSTTPRPGSRSSRSARASAGRTPSPNFSKSRTTPPPAAVIASAIGRTRSATPTNLLDIVSSNADANGVPLTVELQVVAMFDFNGQEEHDLSFKRGDVIDILRRTDSREDWWLGRTAGRVGNLPANFTQDI